MANANLKTFQENTGKKLTPKQMVMENFGGKQKLIDQLKDVLLKDEDESKDDYSKRVKRIPNKKLLRLYSFKELVNEKFGSKEKLIDQIVKNRLTLFGNQPPEYKTRLNNQGLGRLLDENSKLETLIAKQQ